MPAAPLIYLCGPIHGLTFDDGNSWRLQAERLLAPEFGVLSPLRGKTFVGTDYSHYTDEEIVLRDLSDIRKARGVLRFIPAGASHGSDMETFYASNNCQIPVVTFGPGQSNRAALPLWLRRFTAKNFEQLDEAVEYFKSMWTYPGDGQVAEPAYSAPELLDMQRSRSKFARPLAA